MYTMLVSLAIGLIAGYYIGKLVDGFFGFIVCLMCLVFGWGAASGLGSIYPVEREVLSSVPLHNLYDDSLVEGSFFLGSGTLGEVDYFFYNFITPEGYIKPAKIDKYTENLYVLEDGAENPRFETTANKFIDPDSWKWGLVSLDVKKIFHIPPGSVDTNFTVK